jgi:hypothetical protein
MPWPRTLDVERERRGQGEHPQRIGGGGAVDHDVVPLPRPGQLPHLVQTEHLLHTGQRRKFLGRNLSQL